MLIGEGLLDTPPTYPAVSLMGEKALKFRTYGSEYLNVQFGWLPFVNELMGIIESLCMASVSISQLKRDSDRQVRRKFVFDEGTTNVVTEHSGVSPFVSGAVPVAGPMFPGDSARIRKTVRTTRNAWFSGAYMYHLAGSKTSFEKLQRYEQMANYLLGTRITPEVLWELAPWSWLVDWFVNIGDIISNATRLSEDGLVLKYGYLMVHTKRETILEVAPQRILGTSNFTPPCSLTFTRETKQRYRSGPFGFGLDMDSLNGTQKAILVALGISLQKR